jgi:small subunit ribosomal protein S17e
VFKRQGLINFIPILTDTMGRVRQTYVKRLARDLVNADEEKFSEDFDENKEELKETEEFNSKRLRNRVAGYIVRVKQNKEL